MLISRRVLKNGRERLVCYYGGVMELVAATRTMINWKQQWWEYFKDEFDWLLMETSVDGGWAGQVYVGPICMIGPHLPCHHFPFLVITPHDCIRVPTDSTTCPWHLSWVWLSEHVVTYLDEWSQLDEGGQVNWPPQTQPASTISLLLYAL